MFALFFAIIMRGFQKGSYAKMKENAIESYSGYLQIHKSGYWDDKNINNVFSLEDEIIDAFTSDSRVIEVIPRLESFALVSSGESTKGAAVIGISPEKEDKMTRIQSYLEEGEYLNSHDKAVLLGADLAKFLKVKIGDTLVLFSTGYHGQTAAGLYPVKGILKLPIPEMNRGTVYLPIDEAQQFFSTENQLTALVFDLHEMDDVNGMLQTINESIDTHKYEVMDWEVMNKELLQMIESDNAGGIIMVSILYLVIAFGIFGTVLMMTNERIREFSVMISIGMQKSRLAFIVIVELFILTALAVVAGILISLPVMIYFVYHPIKFTGEALDAMKDFNFEPVMPISMEPEIFIVQAISISIITGISMSYPTIKIMTLDIVNGLRS